MTTQQEYLLALEMKKESSALQAAYQRLLLFGMSKKDIHQLRITKKISKTITIYSPISGVVIDKTAFAGMRIEANNDLYTIADLSHLWILGDIYEYELPYIHEGQTAEVTLSYLPQKTFTAVIRFIYPTIDSQTRAAKVRFEIDNTNQQLKPGMYVNLAIKIPLGEKLVVPKNAVLLTGERAVIFINHGNGKIEWREVTMGVRTEDNIEITKGVHEGEQVITSANFLIDSESQLKAAMGNMQH